MNIFRIAWRSIQQRGLASLLTAISMALGVMLVVAVLLISGVVTESFRSNSSLGYNMIVGAKGGSLQLVLNSVFYLSKPIENIPYDFYQEFLPASERNNGQKGEFQPLTKFAIPLCLGDYYQGFRVVGTTPEMFEDFVYDPEKNRKYEFSSGQNFKEFTPKHGYFEAVLGSQLAKTCGLKVGDRFSPTHGPEGDAHDEFFIVGILAPSGTPNDRAAFVNLEGFLLLDGHAKTASEASRTCPHCGEKLLVQTRLTKEQAALPPPSVTTWESYEGDLDEVSELDEKRRRMTPLPVDQREVTAILLRTVSPLVSQGLVSKINEPDAAGGNIAQAVLPIFEITQLFATIVGPIKWVLLAITAMVCVVSGVSIFVSIYNSMSERRHEIAVMRALGAGRQKIMAIVLLESVLLSLAGGFFGWLAGHLLIGGLASPFIEERTGVSVGIFDFAPKVSIFEFLSDSPLIEWSVSSELLLVPALVILAILVGFLPALSAYRTDVSKSLSASP